MLPKICQSAGHLLLLLISEYPLKRDKIFTQKSNNYACCITEDITPQETKTKNQAT